MTKQARSYRDYPKAYFTILDALQESPTVEKSFKMPYRQAASTRRDFYRFFRALEVVYETDRSSRELCDFTRDVTISVSPSRAAPTDEATITFAINILAQLVGPSLRERLEDAVPDELEEESVAEMTALEALGRDEDTIPLDTDVIEQMLVEMQNKEKES